MVAEHVAVILAAGGSRRLGRPKQLLSRAGEPLIRHVVRMVAETAPRTLHVVIGGYRDAVAANLVDLPCQLVENPLWREGLGSSLRTVARHVAAAAAPVLLTVCDQPALQLPHLQWLLAAADIDNANGNIKCAATLHTGMRGIPAVVPPAWFSDPDRLGGERGFGPRLRALAPMQCAELDAPDLMFDLDSEDDVHVAVARGWLDPANLPGS